MGYCNQCVAGTSWKILYFINQQLLHFFLCSWRHFDKCTVSARKYFIFNLSTTFTLLLVHGGYSLWSSWTVCSQSCDGGVQTRSRTCTKPKPAHGGLLCSQQRLGPATQLRNCNTRIRCPGNVIAIYSFTKDPYMINSRLELAHCTDVLLSYVTAKASLKNKLLLALLDILRDGRKFVLHMRGGVFWAWIDVRRFWSSCI